MSLSHFVKIPDIRDKLKPLRPKLPRKINVALKVESCSPRYMLVGTAFDYLLRFELQRQAPHAISRPLVGEAAIDMIWESHNGGGSFLNLLKDDQGMVTQLTGPNACMVADRGAMEDLAKEVAGRARNAVEKAKSAITAYLKNKSPTRPEKEDLAAHAVRLAKLEELCRSSRFDPSFEEADQEDVEELLALLAVVPVGELLHDKILLLNPTFGESSRLVGGADADLIAGDTLIDFKTTKAGEVTAEYLDQLLGYFLLARNQSRADPKFPIINRLAIYFCRHGHLWPLNSSAWTEHPQFAEIEQWFFSRAKEEFRHLNSKPN
jgi:hypothetical protein